MRSEAEPSSAWDSDSHPDRHAQVRVAPRAPVRGTAPASWSHAPRGLPLYAFEPTSRPERWSHPSSTFELRVVRRLVGSVPRVFAVRGVRRSAVGPPRASVRAVGGPGEGQRFSRHPGDLVTTLGTRVDERRVPREARGVGAGPAHGDPGGSRRPMPMKAPRCSAWAEARYARPEGPPGFARLIGHARLRRLSLIHI